MSVDRETRLQRMRDRTGLVQLGTRPARDAWSAVKRALPRVQDAIRLVELVEARLGDRAERDVWSTPQETCLLLRDREHPGWYLPQRLVYLALDIEPEPEPTFHESVPLEMQEQFRRSRQGPEGVLPLPGARTGRLMVHEGDAYLDIRWNTRGLFEQWMATRGDMFFGDESKPFLHDPHLRPPPPPPLSMLTRDDLDPAGLPLEVLAAMITELRPEEMDLGRVWCPVVQPGMVVGTWARGLRNLRRAAWEGRVPETGGWVVIDAWNGTAIAGGATFDEAFQAWRASLDGVLPLPPVEREPEPDPGEAEPFLDSETTEEDGRIVTRAEMRIVIHPPVRLAWPAARPENVPAIAIPVAAVPAIPDGLARQGYTRVVRLFGERGGSGFAFVRDEDAGFTFVGDEAVPALELDALDAHLDEVDAASRHTFATDPFYSERNMFERPEYPVRTLGYRVWDETGRVPELVAGGYSWGAELGVEGWDLPSRHTVMRVRYLQLGW